MRCTNAALNPCARRNCSTKRRRKINSAMFRDREDAGEKLGDMLTHYRGQNAVVLALPRGGVVLGRAVAKKLRLPLDIVVTRKIGHPTSPEYAIGVVDESGTTIL